jgi:hypothetical protein
MKFTVPVGCSSCGCNFAAPGCGGMEFPPAQCPRCGVQIHILDPLTISIIADRLLLRSQSEIDGRDFTISIICSAMAVECALTQVFIKWKGLDHFRSTGQQPTSTEQDTYEQEYRKKASPGGFAKSADFVSFFLVGKKYDDFVADFVDKSKESELIKAGFPQYASQMKSENIHKQLFVKRNRIMHWGEVTFDKDDASAGLAAAGAAISALKVMDREKYLAMEREWRSSMKN